MGARETRKGGGGKKRRTRRLGKEDTHVHTVSVCTSNCLRTYIYRRVHVYRGPSGGNKSFTSKDTRRERIFTVQEDLAFLLGPAPFLFDKIYLNRASSDCTLLPSLPFLHRLAFAARNIYIYIYISLSVANTRAKRRHEGNLDVQKATMQDRFRT